MRIKSSKGMALRIQNSERFIEDPYSYKGEWDRYFGNTNELHMELGMGKGDFIAAMAERNPDINYIGIEKYTMVIARAAGKLEETAIKNVALIVDDVENIGMMTDEESIGRIYLNFLDPWPKNKHEKRRCTNFRFLDKYRAVLRKEAQIHFKTDNELFYEYSLANFMEAGFEIVFNTRDLYKTKEADYNMQSEYEKKFVQQDISIKKIIARRM